LRKSTPALVLTFSCLLALPPGGAGDPPFLLQDRIERPEPFERTPLRVNPPTFRWPAQAATRGYEVQLSRSPEFHDAVTRSVRETFHRPPEPLAEGRWYWRYRASGGSWSPPESFEITSALPKWPIPDWPEIISRVPSARPRIYVRPEQVEAYRARAAGPLKDLVRRWAARRQASIGAALPTPAPRAPDQPMTEGREERLRRQKIATWAAKSGAQKLMEPVTDLAWLWMLTGEQKFADEARRRVLAAAQLDPERDLSERTSDFANATVAAHSAVAYDMLHDRFSAAERVAVRAMLRARIEPIMRKLRQTPQRLFGAHAWQRIFMEGLTGALALYGEEPVAREWIETGLKSFIAFYPWYGGLDGGSAEGANYYTCCNMLSSLDARDVFHAAFGIDFARSNPWYRNNPYYLIYVLPPGGISSQLGDVNPQRLDAVPGSRHRLAALRMAALYDNAWAADYAGRISDPFGNDALFERFRWSPFADLRPEPLDRLPPAHVFYDIGAVFMHSAITRPEENVRLEFRSSPYGGTGHGHSDQNTFGIIAFNEPLIVDSGYYTAAGDRHHAGWTRQTKAHNTILVDGAGQPREEGFGPRAGGTIRHFEQTGDWVYAAGSAAAAYSVKLDRFDRHLVWLRGADLQTYVILDDLEATGAAPHRFEWLLHAAREMTLDPAAGRALIRNRKAEAEVRLVEPRPVEMTQTDRFDPPPENWRPDRKYDLKNQWHLKVTPAPARALRFVAVIQVSKPGAPRLNVEKLDAGVRVGNWKVRLDGRRAVIQPAG